MNTTQIAVTEPQTVCNFLMTSLRFTFCEHVAAGDGSEGLVVAFHEKAADGLFLVKAEPNSGDTTIVVPTEDCLRDYYELLCNGLSPDAKPFYTELGLELSLKDEAGNEYRLLEKRNYAEI